MSHAICQLLYLVCARTWICERLSPQKTFIGLGCAGHATLPSLMKEEKTKHNLKITLFLHRLQRELRMPGPDTVIYIQADEIYPGYLN